MTLYELENSFRRQVLLHALDAHCGNVTAAARSLGVDRNYIYKLLKASQIMLGHGRKPCG